MLILCCVYSSCYVQSTSLVHSTYHASTLIVHRSLTLNSSQRGQRQLTSTFTHTLDYSMPTTLNQRYRSTKMMCVCVNPPTTRVRGCLCCTLSPALLSLCAIRPHDHPEQIVLYSRGVGFSSRVAMYLAISCAKHQPPSIAIF